MAPQADEQGLEALADQVSALDADTVRAALQDRMLGALDLAAALRQVRAPLLLLRGDWAQGATVRDEDAEFTLANLPAAVVAQIPGGTHLFHQEQQDTTLRHVEAFLGAS